MTGRQVHVAYNWTLILTGSGECYDRGTSDSAFQRRIPLVIGRAFVFAGVQKSLSDVLYSMCCLYVLL